MKPENANPRNFKVDKIIYTDPNRKDFSIAIGVWQDDQTKRLAMRWNGDIANPNDKGYPSVFEHPMWFQLPLNLKEIIKALEENSELIPTV